jgi:hypothetical protein
MAFKTPFLVFLIAVDLISSLFGFFFIWFLLYLVPLDYRDVISPVTFMRLAGIWFPRSLPHSSIPRALSVPGVRDSEFACSGIPCTVRQDIAGKMKSLPRKSQSE